MRFTFQQEIKKLAFIDTRDIAAVAVHELTRDGTQRENAIFHITGQEALSFSQAAGIISSELVGKYRILT